MKKLAIVMMAALLALVICAAALANDTAVELYNKVTGLLFSTNNVTLTASAEFSLDGNWFKTAEGTWKQDGTRSYRKLHLISPRADGTERLNGYVIVTEGTDLYLMEEFTPGIYRTGTTGKRDSILRSSVETKQLISLGSALVSQADVLLGEGSVTKTEDGAYRITLGANTPAIANAALNDLARFAAKRYFRIDFDSLKTDNSRSLYDYVTLTEGILYTVQGVSVRQAEIVLKTDAGGNLQHAEGSIGLYLETSGNGVKQLDITFRADVTDAGSTVLRKFDPQEYGVARTADEAEAAGYETEKEIPEDRPMNGEAFQDVLTNEAMRVWESTGFNMWDNPVIDCKQLENGYEVCFEGGDDGVVKKAHFTEDGRLTDIQAEPNMWQNLPDESYNWDPKPDEQLDKKAREFLLTYLENIHPQKREHINDLKMDWMCEAGGAVYAQYEEYPIDQNDDGVLFVVRLSPEMRIECYACVSNG